MLRTIAHGFESTIDWLLPRRCLMCGLPGGDGNLCPPCEADLPRMPRACLTCGLALEGENDGVCGPCLRKSPIWDGVTAALAYRFPVDVLVSRFKFSRNLACGDALSRLLAEKITGALREPGHTVAAPEVIVPVPLHRARHLSRTFNQSELLARHVGRRCGIPVDCRLLQRVRKTSAQSGLDARSRRKNTRGAFHCKYRRAEGIRHVALVDDVMTTGATLESCTRELKRAGIGTVSVWVVARAPPP